jgi:hypothetical protein
MTSTGTLMATAPETPTPNFDNVTVNAGVTVQSTGGDVVFQAGDDIVITAGATVHASGNISLTSAFGDTDAEGAIQLNGAVVATAGVLTLNLGAFGPATEGALGSLQANALLLLGTGATGSFTLSSAGNQVSLIAANTAAAIILQTSAALTVGSVGVTNGIQTSGNNLTLCNLTGDLAITQPINAGTVRLASGGGVSQTSAGVITAAHLGVLADGPVGLDGATNVVSGVFAAKDLGTTSADSIAFLDNVAFSIVYMVPAADCFTMTAVGVTTAGPADITLCNIGGDLGLGDPVSSGTGTTHGTVRLSVGHDVGQNSSGVITAAALGVVAGADVLLDSATNQVAGTFAANASLVVRFLDGSGFTIGNVSAASCFTGASGVMGGTDVTLCTGGSLFIGAPITTGGTVRLSAGGGVSQSATGVITAANLGIVAGGAVGLDVATNVVSGVFAAKDLGTTSADSIAFLDNVVFITVSMVPAADCFTMAAVGVTTAGPADITLCNLGGDLGLADPVGSGTGTVHGTVRLSVAHDVGQNALGVITAAALGVVAGADVLLDSATNQVAGTFAANASLIVRFLDGGAFTIGNVPAASCFTGANGVTGPIEVTLCTGGNLFIGAPITTGGTVRLSAGGGVTQNPAGVITATNLGVLAGADILLDGATNQISAVFAANTNGLIRFLNSGSFTVGTIFPNSCFAGANGVGTAVNTSEITLCSLQGSVTITTPVTGGTIRLSAGGAVTQSASGKVTGTNLGVLAHGLIDLSVAPDNFVPGSLAANDSGTANSPIRFRDASGFTVGIVSADPVDPACFGGATGVTTANNNDITLIAGGALTVNQPINSGTGTILLLVGTIATFDFDGATFNAVITAGTATVTGSGPASKLVMNYTVDTTWHINGTNLGTLSNSQIHVPGPGFLTFTNFGFLTGGPGHDDFVFGAAGIVTGDVDGQGNIDTLDFSSVIGAVQVMLTGLGFSGFNGQVHPFIGGSFLNIDQVIGNGNTASTLTGPNRDTAWTINGINQGFLTDIQTGQTLTFSGFPNLTGGNANDSFTFVTNFAALTGRLDGGAGNNTLRYSNANAAAFQGYYAVNVRLTGFGGAVGFAGNDGGLIIGSGFTNISNLDGGYAAAGNSLAGLNLPAQQIWNVRKVMDPQYPFGNLGGDYTPVNGPTLFFSRFQTLFGGLGSAATDTTVRANTFNVSSTPAGVFTSIFGNVHNDAFIVGDDTVGLDNVQGPVGFNGGGFDSDVNQHAPTTSLTATCPPKFFSTTLPQGDSLIINDAANTSDSTFYTLDEETAQAAAYFSRNRPGDNQPQGTFYFGNVQTMNFITGTGADSIAVGNTYAYTINTITAPPTTTKGNVLNLVSTGTGSITTLQEGGAGVENITAQHTGDNSGLHVIGGNGNTINFSPAASPGSNSGVLLEGGPGPTTFNVFLAPVVNNPGTLIQVKSGAATTLQFPDFDQANFVVSGNTIRLSSSGVVVLCFDTTVVVPQNSFVVGSYLLPNPNPSVKPSFQIFIQNIPVAGLPPFFAPGPLVNTPFAPVIAQPTFNSQFGFSAPTVTVADVNGDGSPDLIVAMGSGFEPLVTIFDGNGILGARAGGVNPRILAQFFAFDSTFVAGVYVAAGNLNNSSGPGKPDIIVGAGRGGFPFVQVFEFNNSYNPALFPGGGVSLRSSFLAYDQAFRGGVRVAAGDVNGDGHDDIITGAGPGGAPHVEAFSGADGSLLRSFFAYDLSVTAGLYVAAGNYDPRDVNPTTGLKEADILTGAGFGAGPHVEVFHGGLDPQPRPVPFVSFFAFDTNPFSGVGSVAFSSVKGSLSIVVGSGPGHRAEVKIYKNDPNNLMPPLVPIVGDVFINGALDITGNIIGPQTFPSPTDLVEAVNVGGDPFQVFGM